MRVPSWLTPRGPRNTVQELLGPVLATELKSRARKQTEREVDALFEMHATSLHELRKSVVAYVNARLGIT